MKLALSSKGKNLNSRISSVFGRCQFFIIAEVEDGEILRSESLENSAASQPSGAGTAAAQMVGDEGVEALITNSIGPKAFSALKQWDIQVYEGKSGTVRENIDKLSSDELEELESPTGPAHSGPNKKR